MNTREDDKLLSTQCTVPKGTSTINKVRPMKREQFSLPQASLNQTINLTNRRHLQEVNHCRIKNRNEIIRFPFSPLCLDSILGSEIKTGNSLPF